MRDSAPKILLIAGDGRSGSTLLSLLLNLLPGFHSVGELSYVWERGVLGNQLCGCGRAFAVDPFWQSILGRLELPHGLALEDSARRMTAWGRAIAGVRGFVRARRATFAVPLQASLYQAVADETGCRVVVDSSKSPGYVLSICSSGLPVTVVHLVRDGRAVAFSNQRRKLRPEIRDSVKYMPRLGAARSAYLWCRSQLLSEMIGHLRGSTVHRLRYEDLVQQPEPVLRWLDEIMETSAPPPTPSVADLVLGENHLVSGNPLRFARGALKIRQDDEWRSALSQKDKFIVTAMSLPLLRRYGYPIWPRATQSGDRL